MKLLRDLRRLWAQALAIALVMAAGVATLVLGVGAVDSLERTRDAYYEANRFADVFATATRAPRTLLPRIESIDGVLEAEGRIRRIALLDMPGMAEPGSLLLVSLPGADGLNRLHLREGRLPDPRHADEAVVSQGFAASHALGPGSRMGVLMNGRMRELRVTGVAISPEFVYALGPGDMMPDPRRFGIAWLPDESLAAAYDFRGAFDDVALNLAPGASPATVMERLDAILAPYGGTGATGRKDQVSHAFLDAELTQLRGMSRVLPPIFLLVAAFLVNMTLGRLVTLEREQIGLLKALGYGPWAIARHYVGFVLAIAAVGILLGWVAGAWMGVGLARLYVRFFDFPNLVFSRNPEPYAIAALVTVGAAVAGAIDAVRRVAWLPPAVAMSPPAPVRYRRLWGGAAERLLRIRQSTVMIARHLLRWPLRTASGVLGMSLAVAVLVGSLWSTGSIEKMIDLTFDRAERQDAMLTFAEPRPMAALFDIRRMPGVLRAEPVRIASVRLSHGPRERQVALIGSRSGDDLSRLLDIRERPMAPPDAGVVLSEALADLLGVEPGDRVRVDVLEGDRRSFEMPVSGVSLGYLGLSAAIALPTLNGLLGEGPRITGTRVQLDPARADDFFAAVKATPQAGFVMLLDRTLRRFRETMAQNITIQITVYLTLAAIIAFGVVYNFARISLSEQGRELASLRVLGFTRGEVAAILYGEIAAVVLVAQPLGWLIGTGFAMAVVRAFSSELYRVPLVINSGVYAVASLVALAAALASALLVRGRIDRLDLIEVLKTRE
ncbi:ABC-type antimicrobial peptide transport system, permease component [Rubellimicrobium mesophilum DSM 19309]|uniref:ABC-type antimicrobial peptide transport system, permease component n=1 Tax=Rubellimicrobium mesophilum DSM 19309 TaxID=442562 RepID=A0A017HJA8_9RHOB|nr:FtsX-like permease family protein [Rubellimicrobium mesophilum]EYD74248.1 ABC-type antimicrobial peptide transport system, permease component [Rubellimicrobium mesophilum DSM 19309]